MEQLKEIEGYHEVLSEEQAGENLWYVMVEKTEGEAALKVKICEPGDGFGAYMRVYLWYAGTTGMALSEKMSACMTPKVPTHEHELADYLDRWAEQERTLRARGEDYAMAPALKVTALRTIMGNKREQFESLEREAKAAHGGK